MSLRKPLLNRRAFLHTTAWLGALALVQYNCLAISASAPAAAEATIYGAGAYGAGAYGAGTFSATLADQRLTKEA